MSEETPTIRKWLDEHQIKRKLKYVWQQEGGYVETHLGRCHIPYGFLSDGDTGVPDLCPVAFFAHDRLYCIPIVKRENVEVRLNQYECDLFYAIVLWRYNHYFAATRRFLGLFGINKLLPNSPWKKNRRMEQTFGSDEWINYISQNRIVPKANCWAFPTEYVADAVWAGS